MSEQYFIVKIAGLDSIILKLDDTYKKSQDVSPALKKGGDLMLSSINKNFQAGGRPTQWTPLKPSTLAQKARQGYSSKPLIREGHLRSSIVYDVSPNTLTIGTSIPYGAIHQFGGTIKHKARTQTLAFGKHGFRSRASAGKLKTKVRVAFAKIPGGSVTIPARKYLLFQDDDIRKINKLVSQYIINSTGTYQGQGSS